ncbi:MAG: hypothetical protein CME61_06795 [Halobacteriovoraceae bacterium]|nr:hypothetical protein [Halobacteriovoraceae bacterium]
MKNKFFLISFLPALVYWYLEANYPVKIAASVGIMLAIVELVLEKVFLKHIHKISIFNFFLILSLGLLSVFAGEGIWFKLQPAFTGVIIGSLLLVSKFRKRSFFKQMMEDLQPKQLPPDWLIEAIEFHSGLFLLVYGLFMSYVAFHLSTSKWLFFKTAGFYLSFLVFMAVEIFYLRYLIKKHALKNRFFNHINNQR